MRVLLINPPYKEVYGGKVNICYPPLGLAYIAAYIHSKHEVRILDAHALNLSTLNVCNEVLEFNPQVVGLTSTTPVISSALDIARNLKERSPNLVIVFGGVHPTVDYQTLLSRYPFIDYIVVGEGEVAFSELLDSFEKSDDVSSVDGIAYSKNGTVRITRPFRLIENLDILPYPAYELLPMKKYNSVPVLPLKRPTLDMITSRGCPFNCNYCSTNRIFGRGTRFRSPDNVLGEIHQLVEKFNARSLHFVDDTFTINHDRVRRICKMIDDEFPGLRWGCNSRVDTITKELMEVMHQAGCEWIAFGVETASPTIMEYLRKGINHETVKKVFKEAREVGVNTHAYFMLGLPDETKEDIQKTVDFSIKLDPDFLTFSMATPYPGTDLYNDVKSRRLIVDDEWWYTHTSPKFNTPVIKTENFNPQYLKKTVKKAYSRFYLQPLFIMRQLNRYCRLGFGRLYDDINIMFKMLS